MTARISGVLKSATGISISEGPPEPDHLVAEPDMVYLAVVTVPYESWPPYNPKPDTLYLRLAP